MTDGNLATLWKAIEVMWAMGNQTPSLMVAGVRVDVVECIN